MSDTKEKKPVKLDLAHFSMQYSDPRSQKKHDVKAIFDRGYDGVTGTEAGQKSLRGPLQVQAHKFGYTMFIGRSNWVSVKKSLIVPKSYRKGLAMIVDNDDYVGPGHALHIAWAQWEMERVGNVALLSGHYATKGDPGQTMDRRINVDPNTKYARGIGDLMEKLGAGRDLAFYQGDQNIDDELSDTFFGEPITTASDELEKYPSTKGKNTIDVSASYDKDGRVEARYFRALSDDKLHLFTDHKGVEAGYNIRPLDD